MQCEEDVTPKRKATILYLLKMGFLSALKRSAGKSDKKSPNKAIARGVRHDENSDPTPLKPLKLSLTPVRTRPSPDIVRNTVDALGSFTNAVMHSYHLVV